MPMYEFRCNAGHEHTELCAVGTVAIVCSKCPPLVYGDGHVPLYATRILSPTRTTFVHADTGRKRQQPIE